MAASATGAWYQGPKTTATQETTLLKPAWDEVLDDSFLGQTPLISMLSKMGSYKQVDRNEFQWASYKERMEYVTVTANTPGSGGTVSNITVSTADSAKITKSLTLRNSRNGQVYYVTETYRSGAGTPAAYHFYAKRVATAASTMSSILAADCVVGDTLYVLNNAAYEKWGDITNAEDYVAFKTEDVDYNYIEMMFAILEMSDLDANSGQWIKGSQRASDMARAQQRMWKNFETKCFTGVRAKNTSASGEQYSTFMGGLDQYGINTETDTLSGYTWDSFKDWIKSEMQVWNRKPNLFAFCNNNMFYKISDWVKNNTDPTFSATGSDSAFGYQVKTLITPGPTIQCVNNRALFEAFGDDAVMYIVDMNLLGIKYFGGTEDSFGFDVITNCQLKGNNNLVDKLQFWPGLEVQHPENMGKLLLTA